MPVSVSGCPPIHCMIYQTQVGHILCCSPAGNHHILTQTPRAKALDHQLLQLRSPDVDLSTCVIVKHVMEYLYRHG